MSDEEWKLENLLYAKRDWKRLMKKEFPEADPEPPPIYPADHEINIPREKRNRHIYILGSQGSGKSTLLERMIVNNMTFNDGVCVLDPKGTLVKRMIHYVPAHRIDETVYISKDTPVPLDVMSYRTQNEKDNLFGRLLSLFMEFVSMKEGDQWVAILRKTLRTILDADNCSFLDIHRMLQSKDFRDKILKRVTSPDLHAYWESEFPALKHGSEQPILSRMSPFIDVAAIAAMFGQSSGLNMYHVISKKQILLVDLHSFGDLGDDIGKIIVTLLRQAAMSRPEKNPEPYFLYCDEFQHFLTSSFDKILEEARAFNLCLTLANQGLYQVKHDAARTLDAIGTNIKCAYIIFQIHANETNFFRTIAEPYDHKILAKLPDYQALFKVGHDPAIIKWTLPQIKRSPASYAQKVKKRTLDKYPCNTAPVSHTEGNVRKSDHIEAQGRPSPPNKGKARGARNSD